jgi:hypothetical protein
VNGSAHRQQQRAIENGAAAAAAFVLGAKGARRVDKGGRQQTRDFDLVFDDHLEPLEVTQHVHQPARETMARLDARGMGFDLDLGRRWWWVSVPYVQLDTYGVEAPLDIERCSRELRPLIGLLEQLGIDEFDTGLLFSDPRLRPFGNPMTELSITSGRSSPGLASARGRVTLIPGGGGAIWTDMIAEALEQEAHHGGNRKKLAALTGAPRRHLFVPIDLSAALVYSAARQAFEFGEMPRIPDLPIEVTTAWAGVGRSTELLVVTPPSPWERHLVPFEVRDHPERLLL